MKITKLALLIIAILATVYTIYSFRVISSLCIASYQDRYVQTTDCGGKRSYKDVYITGSLSATAWIAFVGTSIITRKKRNTD